MSVAIISRQGCDVDVSDVLRRSPEGRARPEALAILKRNIRMSQEIWFGMHDGKIACVWGLAPPSTISNRAYLWLLTTDLVDEHKFLFIRHSQVVVEEALERYDLIAGHVAVGNDTARRWLRWLGARIGPAEDNGYSVFQIRRKKQWH
jgi:hypothetical protein